VVRIEVRGDFRSAAQFSYGTTLQCFSTIPCFPETNWSQQLSVLACTLIVPQPGKIQGGGEKNHYKPFHRNCCLGTLRAALSDSSLPSGENAFPNFAPRQGVTESAFFCFVWFALQILATADDMEVRVIQGVGSRGGRRDWLLSPRWSESAPNTADVPPIFVVMAEAAQV